jgi:hypothetical protein
VGLSAIRAAAARNGIDDLDLFAVFADNEMTDEDGAVHAGTGAQALKAAELRLYSVVVILGWVRIVRYSHGVNLPLGWPGPEEWAASAGPFPFQRPHCTTSVRHFQAYLVVFIRLMCDNNDVV